MGAGDEGVVVVKTAAIALGCGLTLLALGGCRKAQATTQARAPGTRTAATPDAGEVIYAGGFKGTWEEHGWAPRRKLDSGAQALDLHGYYGWLLVNPKLTGMYGGLKFRFKAPPEFGDFLEVRVDSSKADLFPRIVIGPQHRSELGDGWSQVFVSMAELNPNLYAFNNVVLRARVALPPPATVELDELALTPADDSLLARANALLDVPGAPAAFQVDCQAPGTHISPYIYGIAYSAMHEYLVTDHWKVKPTARRWGGNPTSRYNWELGNAWNTASDYFFMNVNYSAEKDFTWAKFLEVNRDRRVRTALTVPMIGWVAKDTTSFSYPVREFGAQQQTSPERPEAGNGVKADGSKLRGGSPARTSVPAPPDFVRRWVEAIRKHEAKVGQTVDMFILDNEPALWNDTHRDVHPEPLGYDELLEKTIAYGTAIRKAAPDALIAGPAEWGWPAYLYSAKDAEAGFFFKPDRRAHDDVPLIEWYLKKLAEHEKKTGVRVLDVLDLHFYPQGNGIGVQERGQTDPETAALRIRSTRALWDPRYVDESWIKEAIQLIPRMKGWVDSNYPGLKLSIGEWNFGAERHLSGGLATAEALGRFGQQGLYSAFYWTYPNEGTPAFWAFRAYRDFDGQGAQFEQVGLPTEAPRDASLFAARSEDGTRLTLVALNFSAQDALEARVTLKGCGQASAQRVFTYVGDPAGFKAREVPLGRAYRLPPSSISVVELTVPKPDAGAP